MISSFPPTHFNHPSSKRFLGIELSGAKNQKTAVAAIEYYPKEKKTFLLDIFDRISCHDGETGDEALLEVIQEMNTGLEKIGVNVPLQLPPCMTCTRKTCPLPKECTVPSVKWMRETTRKAKKSAKPFTPYTQRPIELWVRYSLFSKLPIPYLFEIDETLGGNRAPLTARMSFLKRQFPPSLFLEVWPKLSVSSLSYQLGIPPRVISSYRHLEDGVHSRELILNQLVKTYEIFIYERDMRKLSQSLTSFDAFICAFTALLADQGLCAKAAKGFPITSGWVQYPELKGE